MSEKLKGPDQEINNKLSGLEYKSRPTLQEQLDTVENFREKLKLLRKILEDIRKYITGSEGYYISNSGGLNARFQILLKNFDIVSEIITNLKISKAPITKREIDDFKILENKREEILLYINNKTLGSTVGSRLNQN